MIALETVTPLANDGLLLWFLWLPGQFFFFLKPLWLTFLRWLPTYVILWPAYTTAGVFLLQFDHKITVVWFVEFILISGQCFGLDPDIVKGVARYRRSETGKERAHYLWIEHKALMMRPWFGFVPYGYEKKEQNTHQRDAHLVLHGSSSWLFIRRRGRLCRRWMFLRTTRGTRSTCRFSAVVSWMELLIDFGSTIFSRIYWKSPKWGWCVFTSTFWSRNLVIVSFVSSGYFW